MKNKKTARADEKEKNVGQKFYMPESLHDEIVQSSKQSGISLSAFFRKAAELFGEDPSAAMKIVSRDE